MSTLCREVRESFAGYCEERLSREGRQVLREHLAECAECRREAAAADSTLLFAVPRREEVSAEEVARILAAVRSGIELKAAERRLAAPRRRVAAGLSAAALAALTLALPAGGRRKAEQAPAPPAAAVAEPTPAAGFVPASGKAGDEWFQAEPTIRYEDSELRVVWQLLKT